MRFQNNIAAVLAALSFLSVGALASSKEVTTLRVPVVVGDGQPMNMDEFNQELAAKNLQQLPKYFIVSSEDQNIYKRVQQFDQQVRDLLANIGYGDVGLLFQSVPASADPADVKTCYTGNPKEVIDIIGGMADAIYSDQLSMNAYRVGKTSVMLNDASEEDMKEYLSESKAWQNYDTNSSSLLIISSVGDDGTDVQESLIPVCQ